MPSTLSHSTNSSPDTPAASTRSEFDLMQLGMVVEDLGEAMATAHDEVDRITPSDLPANVAHRVGTLRDLLHAVTLLLPMLEVAIATETGALVVDDDTAE